MDNALAFIQAAGDEPFFLYLIYCLKRSSVAKNREGQLGNAGFGFVALDSWSATRSQRGFESKPACRRGNPVRVSQRTATLNTSAYGFQRRCRGSAANPVVVPDK